MDSLEPTAVPMPRARELLGDKSYSEIYEAIDEGKLVATEGWSEDSHHYPVLDRAQAVARALRARARSEHWPRPGQSGHDRPAHNDQRRRLTRPTIH